MNRTGQEQGPTRRLLQHQRLNIAPGLDPPDDLTLPDVLRPGLDLVFVGINPSIYSAERGQYFARPSNMFWRCLNQSGLVPEPVGPADTYRLLDFGIGLTDIVKRATHDAAELRPEEFRDGRQALRERLVRAAPRVVCFVGKLAYLGFSGKKKAPVGQQVELLGNAAVFVMPSTSGLVNNLQAERIRCLVEVRNYLHGSGM